MTPMEKPKVEPNTPTETKKTATLKALPLVIFRLDVDIPRKSFASSVGDFLEEEHTPS